MKRSLFVLPVLVGAFLIAGCKKDESSPTTPPPPSVDFSTFVTLGNSLTAGYQSSALSARDQRFSFPNLIAGQANVSFEQPLIQDPGIGGRLRLVSIAPLTITAELSRNPGDPATYLNGALNRPYNNLAIPGAITFDLLDTTDFGTKSLARGNPFFLGILRSPSFGKSIVAQAKTLNPTFISVWIGANDVLGYAASGGTRGTDASGTLPTEAAVFDFLYRATIDSMRATGAKMITANIPDVSVIPFFTTIKPYLVGSDGLPVLVGGQKVYLIAIKSGTTQSLNDNDLVTLVAQDSLLAGVGIPAQLGGTGRPLPDRYVLDESEIQIARAAVNAFNSTVQSIASARGIPVVDVHGLLNQAAASGISVEGLGLFTTRYLLGGLFSLDGVHPTSQGHGIVANEFIKKINQTYGTSVPLVNIANLPPIPIGKVPAETVMGYPRIPSAPLEEMVELLAGKGMR